MRGFDSFYPCMTKYNSNLYKLTTPRLKFSRLRQSSTIRPTFGGGLTFKSVPILLGSPTSLTAKQPPMQLKYTAPLKSLISHEINGLISDNTSSVSDNTSDFLNESVVFLNTINYSIVLSSLISTQNQTTGIKHSMLSRSPSVFHINAAKSPSVTASVDTTYNNYFSTKSLKASPTRSGSPRVGNGLHNMFSLGTLHRFLYPTGIDRFITFPHKNLTRDAVESVIGAYSNLGLAYRKPLLLYNSIRNSISRLKSSTSLSPSVPSSKAYFSLPTVRRVRILKAQKSLVPNFNRGIPTPSNLIGVGLANKKRLLSNSYFLYYKPGLLDSVLDNPQLFKVSIAPSLEHIGDPLNRGTSTANNLLPHPSFNKIVFKNLSGSTTSSLFSVPLEPWVNNTLLRFIENCTGKMVMINYSPQINNMVDNASILLYKRWLSHMAYYEKRMGHRFFLEEALHVFHLGFKLHDPKVISSWLKAMIKRISFWKTRSIFRFLKYLFNNYFSFYFEKLNIKGFKLKLKGKISSAGNSRKRLILFRSGKTSYSNYSIKCLHDISTISTFTGVMGFQLWIFY